MNIIISRIVKIIGFFLILMGIYIGIIIWNNFPNKTAILKVENSIEKIARYKKFIDYLKVKFNKLFISYNKEKTRKVLKKNRRKKYNKYNKRDNISYLSSVFFITIIFILMGAIGASCIIFGLGLIFFHYYLKEYILLEYKIK